MSYALPHSLVMYAYCSFGALLLWSKLTAQKKKMQSYGDVIEAIFTSPRAALIMQFIVFVLLGGLVAKILVAPITETQAMAAGMAWSRLTARD